MVRLAPGYTCFLLRAAAAREVYFCAHLLTKRRRVKPNAAELHAAYVDGDGAQVPDSLPQPTMAAGLRVIRTQTSLSEVHRHPPVGHARQPDHGDGLEWEDLMPVINRASDRSNMIWQLIDRATGAVNGEIDWAFTVGDRVTRFRVGEV